jgi:hypothetical protein
MKKKAIIALGIICALVSIALFWRSGTAQGDTIDNPFYVPTGGGVHSNKTNSIGASHYYNLTCYLGHLINVTLTMENTTDYDIYLYGPNQKGYSKNATFGYPENILYTCDWEGNWSVQVYLCNCSAFTNYTLYLDPTNYLPNVPNAPSGPSNGYVYKDYNFSAITTDRENDNASYTFDWGDNTNTTTAFYPPNTTAYASHQWTKPITYNVKVKAQDNHGNWSSYSTTTSITLGPNDDSLGTDAANLTSYAHYLNYQSYYNTTYTSNGTLYTDDPKDEDLINFTAAAGEYIKVTMTPLAGVDFDLKLLAPNGNYWISKNGGGQTETIEITNATVGGNYSMDIYMISGEGFYNFTVSVFPSRVWLTIQVSDSPPGGLKIWVDGTQYNGTTTTNPLHILVFRGTHTIQVQSYFRIGSGKWAIYYCFSYWSDDPTNYYNSRNIYITQDFTTMAVYESDFLY